MGLLLDYLGQSDGIVVCCLKTLGLQWSEIHLSEILPNSAAATLVSLQPPLSSMRQPMSLHREVQ